jgi:hypothetical protein
MRAVLVAAAAAALGLLALANLPTSTPQLANAEKAPSVRAAIAVPVGLDPLTIARADTLNR